MLRRGDQQLVRSLLYSTVEAPTELGNRTRYAQCCDGRTAANVAQQARRQAVLTRRDCPLALTINCTSAVWFPGAEVQDQKGRESI